MKHVLVAALLVLAGCATQPPISASPVHDVLAAAPTSPLQGTITQGLIDASWNLDQAVVVGALDKTDAAPGCLHSVLTDLGIDPTVPPSPAAAASFTPKVSDLISGASVVYIRAQQAAKLGKSGAPSVGLPCKALIGQIMIDGANATARAATTALPGIGSLNSLLPIPLPP